MTSGSVSGRAVTLATTATDGATILASAAMPGLPGVHSSSGVWGERASARTMHLSTDGGTGTPSFHVEPMRAAAERIWEIIQAEARRDPPRRVLV